MESPRRRRGGAEQPTCWSSVVRFPRLSFAAELPAVGPRPPRGRRGLRSKRDPAKSHDRLRSVDPSASDVSAFPPASGSPQTLTPCAPHLTSRTAHARVTPSSRRCVASTPPPTTRAGETRAGPSPPRSTIRRSSRGATSRRPPGGRRSRPGSARPRRPRLSARTRRRRRAATPRAQATEARRAADRATTCAATRRAAAAPRAKANSKNRSTASLLLLARRCGERSAGSYEKRPAPKSARVRRSRERVTNGSSRGTGRARGGAVSTANAKRSRAAKGKRKRTTARIPSRFRGTSRRG